MAFQWMRRVLLALAPAALLALAACGSGTIESQFHPTRMVVFGDGMSDMGNTGVRFSVNDNSTAMWVKLAALDYGVSLDKSASGGTDYANINARVVAKPDPAGSSTTPTIKEQIDAFLAANGSFTDNDFVVIQGGTSDIIVQMAAYRAGTITGDQLLANVKQAGRDMAAQAKRLTAAGANHVAVIGVYDMSRSPWAVMINQQALLTTVSTAFNDALLIDLVDQGSKMLYIDWALLFNLMVGNPASYALTNVADPVCTSVDPGPGIGIGAGQVSSALCTPTTIVSGANYSTYMWADAVYPTPSVHSRLADYTFSRVRNRW
jgi:phospholipase/lecithinase/hemolysin